MDEEELDAALDGIIDRAFKFVPPPVLYHYTSWDGLRGILSSCRIWCTRHDHTNDTAELVSASQVVEETATDLIEGAENKNVQEAIKFFLENYQNWKVAHFVRVYLACFSEAKDDPDQWRKYGDMGRGVCIGLNVLDEPFPENPGLGAWLVKVDYSEDSWRAHVRQTFEKVCGVIMLAPVSNQSIALGAAALFRIAAMEEMRAKQAKWDVEQETRLAVLERPKGDPKWMPITEKRRPTKTGEAAYVDIFVRQPGRLLSLAEVLVGPNQDAAEAKELVREILAESRYHVGQPEYPVLAESGVPATGFREGRDC